MADNSTDNSPNFDPESSTDYTPPTYEFSPEEESRIAELQSFDPVFDVPGPVSADKGTISRLLGNNTADSLTLSSLSPELRTRVQERLASSPGLTEREAVREALYQHAYELNVFSGPGEGASPYQREYFALADQITQVENELFDIELKFAAAVGWDNEVDPRTGKSAPKQIDKMEPSTRQRLGNRRDDLQHRLGLLQGFEGKRRLQKALRDTLDKEAAQRRAAEIEEAADRRADEIVREEEIEERARARAKFRRTER